MRMLRLFAAVVVALAGWLPAASAQERQPSIAEIARKVREQRKQAPTPGRVWTNENLPRSPGAVSVLGTPTPQAEGETPSAQPQAELTPEQQEQEKEREGKEKELDLERQHLQRAKGEVELMEREHRLLTQQFYGDPAQATNPTGPGRARLDQLAGEIETKKQEIQETELKVALLEDELKTLEATFGPKPEKPKTSESDREAWVARFRPLREELARVEREIQRTRADAAAQGLSISAAAGTGAGSLTGDLINRLERRRTELQQQIAALEEEARRAGVPPAWLR